jgi:hypothetical protein
MATMASTTPAWLHGVVLTINLGLAALLLAGVDSAAARTGVDARVRTVLRRRTAIVLGGWLLLAGAVAAADPAPLAPAVLLLIGGPVVVGYVGFRWSSTMRRLVRATPPERLVAVQVYRVIGAVFLLLWADGVLPAYFALPAGVGDVVTGLGAGGVAALCAGRHRGWRAAVLGWNAVGGFDLVVAVGAGSTLLAGPLAALFGDGGVSTAPVVAFPLGLIPMFLVPVSLLLHLYSVSLLVADGESARSAQG